MKRMYIMPAHRGNGLADQLTRPNPARDDTAIFGQKLTAVTARLLCKSLRDNSQ
jgi:hypothetical protein